ncbi:MAG: lytic transglycosylase domain-containing protein, partial [Alphaproteobacteria bacterium]|nr:lytic transglycosylase domain-containing protein [Alphaproteobacteria bacterium]
MPAATVLAVAAIVILPSVGICGGRAFAFALRFPVLFAKNAALPEKRPRETDRVVLPVRRPATAAPEKAKPNPDSLGGMVFDHIGAGARLDSADVRRYARIFYLQDRGDFRAANAEIRRLTDDRIVGNVLYQRYTGHLYHATYDELADWMRRYAGDAGAEKIYDLALKRRPRHAAERLDRPRLGHGLVGYHDYDSGQLAQPYMAEQTSDLQQRRVIHAIDENLSARPTAALRALEKEQGLFGPTEYDALRARVAESYFYNDKTDDAYAAAAASTDRSGAEVPLAAWIAGLSAWKKGKYGIAAHYFSIAAVSPRASAWQVSAAAYWAARSYLRDYHPEKVSFWLQKAAAHPRSFYGIIAVKSLGMEQTRFNWVVPELDGGFAAALARLPAGKRALALMDAHQPGLAEQEIRQIDPGRDVKLQKALLAFAHAAGEPDFEMRLGSGIVDSRRRLYDAALYPDAPWPPEGGYKIDKALVFAFIRQESKFNPAAANKSSGARGLMQLLPSTALHMARQLGIRIGRGELEDPAVNIRLGQAYLRRLLHEEAVRGSLLKLCVAYNAGPGKLARWEKTVDYQ